MFDIKQFTTKVTCLNCQGCCRFLKENSIWQPSLTLQEVQSLPQENIIFDSKKIKVVSGEENSYKCVFLNTKNNKCLIYDKRPLECRLYPFLINKTKEGIFLSIDLKCPFLKDKLDNKEYKDYVNYLISFLSLPAISFAIKQNPQIFTDYSEEENIKNLATLIF